MKPRQFEMRHLIFLPLVVGFFLGCDSNDEIATFEDCVAQATQRGQDDPELYCSLQPVRCSNEGDVAVEDLFVSDNPSRPRSSSTVVMNYAGTLEDGSEFDSGEDVRFALSNTILGFRIGVAGDGGDIEAMRIHSRRHIEVPPNYGYGIVPIRFANDSTRIPACSVLNFEIELVDIEE